MEANAFDKVEIRLPASEEHAKLLRLVVAGIASRVDFDVDKTEDIKMGLEEVYLMAIRNESRDDFDVLFEIHPNRLEIVVSAMNLAGKRTGELQEKFGFSIMNSVMDMVEWGTNDTDAKNLRMIKFK